MRWRSNIGVGVVIMFFLVAISSCDKKSDPLPQGLFTYTLEVDQQWWMFASGPDGKVMDMKKLVFGQPVSLQAANPPDSFSITFVRAFDDNQKVLDITTYGGMKPGGSYSPTVYKTGEFTPPEQLGKSTLQVTKYPSGQSLPLIYSDRAQSSVYYSSGSSTVTFPVTVWKNNTDKMYVSGYSENFQSPVYKFVDAVDVGKTATADFTTFKPFTNTLDLEPYGTSATGQVQFNMYSLEANDYLGYKLASIGWSYSGASQIVKVGFPEEINNYFIDVTLYEYDSETQKIYKSMSYTHKGAKPGEIGFLDNELDVFNEPITGFAFTFDGSYQVQSQTYAYETTGTRIAWTVFSGSGLTMPVMEVPSELRSLFADLDVSKMAFKSATFFTFTDGYNYRKMIEDRFTTSYAPDHPGYSQTFYKTEE